MSNINKQNSEFEEFVENVGIGISYALIVIGLTLIVTGLIRIL